MTKVCCAKCDDSDVLHLPAGALPGSPAEEASRHGAVSRLSEAVSGQNTVAEETDGEGARRLGAGRRARLGALLCHLSTQTYVLTLTLSCCARAQTRDLQLLLISPATTRLVQ